MKNCPAAFYSRKGKPLTTIDAKELNDRVRHGNGCDLFAIATELKKASEKQGVEKPTSCFAFYLIKMTRTGFEPVLPP
jgi:hypothetical protein